MEYVDIARSRHRTAIRDTGTERHVARRIPRERAYRTKAVSPDADTRRASRTAAHRSCRALAECRIKRPSKACRGAVPKRASRDTRNQRGWLHQRIARLAVKSQVLRASRCEQVNTARQTPHETKHPKSCSKRGRDSDGKFITSADRSR